MWDDGLNCNRGRHSERVTLDRQTAILAPIEHKDFYQNTCMWGERWDYFPPQHIRLFAAIPVDNETQSPSRRRFLWLNVINDKRVVLRH